LQEDGLLLSTLILFHFELEEFKLLPGLLLLEVLLPQFQQVLVTLSHALPELLVKILAHLVELIPFTHHLLQLLISLHHLFPQLRLQELQMRLIDLLFFSLQRQNLFESVRWQRPVSYILGRRSCAREDERGLDSGLGVERFVEPVDLQRLDFEGQGVGDLDGGHADNIFLAVQFPSGTGCADQQDLQLHLLIKTFCAGSSSPSVVNYKLITVLKRRRLPVACAECVGGENAFSK
jgi:hypothetical protein